MGPEDADGMANSVDPDQTAPPQTYLSKNHYGIPYWTRLLWFGPSPQKNLGPSFRH